MRAMAVAPVAFPPVGNPMNRPRSATLLLAVAVVALAEVVNRHDAGVLETASDFRLLEKSGAAVGIVGVAVVEFFQRDFAVELVVAGDGDFAQAAGGVEDAGAGEASAGVEHQRAVVDEGDVAVDGDVVARPVIVHQRYRLATFRASHRL